MGPSKEPASAAGPEGRAPSPRQPPTRPQRSDPPSEARPPGRERPTHPAPHTPQQRASRSRGSRVEGCSRLVGWGCRGARVRGCGVGARRGWGLLPVAGGGPEGRRRRPAGRGGCRVGGWCPGSGGVARSGWLPGPARDAHVTTVLVRRPDPSRSGPVTIHAAHRRTAPVTCRHERNAPRPATATPPQRHRTAAPHRHATPRQRTARNAPNDTTRTAPETTRSGPGVGACRGWFLSWGWCSGGGGARGGVGSRVPGSGGVVLGGVPGWVSATACPAPAGGLSDRASAPACSHQRRRRRSRPDGDKQASGTDGPSGRPGRTPLHRAGGDGGVRPGCRSGCGCSCTVCSRSGLLVGPGRRARRCALVGWARRPAGLLPQSLTPTINLTARRPCHPSCHRP